MARLEGPFWWDWDLELSPHVLKRMEDRRFTEVELRGMLDRAVEIRRDIEAGRWVVVTRLRRRRWEVILEPDRDSETTIVIIAYPL